MFSVDSGHRITLNGICAWSFSVCVESEELSSYAVALKWVFCFATRPRSRSVGWSVGPSYPLVCRWELIFEYLRPIIHRTKTQRPDNRTTEFRLKIPVAVCSFGGYPFVDWFDFNRRFLSRQIMVFSAKVYSNSQHSNPVSLLFCFAASHISRKRGQHTEGAIVLNEHRIAKIAYTKRHRARTIVATVWLQWQ